MSYDNYEICQIATISTCHVTPETRERWTNIIADDGYVFDTNYVIYDKDGFGFFMYITTNKISDDQSDDINNLMQFANNINADIICLDSDGPQVNGLACYEDE